MSPDTSYDLSVRIRTAKAAGDSLLLTRTCELYDAAACAGAASSSGLDVLSLQDSAGVWDVYESQFDTSASAQSMLCAVDLYSPAGSGFTSHLDNLELAPDPGLIFADGFESGDTSKWSATVP